MAESRHRSESGRSAEWNRSPGGKIPIFHPPLQETVAQLLTRIDSMDAARRALLKPLTRFIQQRVDAERPIRWNFICTHNSRRSHLGQLWGAVAAAHFKIPRVATFSGSTQATAFNPRAARAISLPYRDPKEADDTPEEEARYTQRSHQIGTEILAAFAALGPKSA